MDDFNYHLGIYKQDLDAKNAELTNYNARVDEVNKLIKESGTRWYLIPLPGKSTKLKLPAK